MDRISQEQRRRVMQAVKSTGSAIESALAKALWRKGYRYCKNVKRLCGKPDLVFVKFRIVVFCDSDFWHGYKWRHRKWDIKSNRKFWFTKIKRNIERDKEVTQMLRREGWTVIRFWGHKIENDLDSCVEHVEKTIMKKKQTIGKSQS